MANITNPHSIRFPNQADMSDTAWAHIKEVIEALPANATAGAIRRAQAEVDAIAPIGLFEADMKNRPEKVLALIMDKLYDEKPGWFTDLVDEHYALPDAA